DRVAPGAGSAGGGRADLSPPSVPRGRRRDAPLALPASGARGCRRAVHSAAGAPGRRRLARQAGGGSHRAAQLAGDALRLWSRISSTRDAGESVESAARALGAEPASGSVASRAEG